MIIRVRNWFRKWWSLVVYLLTAEPRLPIPVELDDERELAIDLFIKGAQGIQWTEKQAERLTLHLWAHIEPPKRLYDRKM